MSTSAKSLVPAATRAIASDDPLAMLVVTASASALNRPPALRHHERRRRGIDRTVERELDRERRPGLVRGQYVARHQAHNRAQAGRSEAKRA